jgi:uncharacterized protein involved in type VI secretion and phage assembly
MGVFDILLADAEERDRGSCVPGLRYAEIKEIRDDGYILTWLSGPVSSPSAPARAASFMAGKERGGYFPFEIGDEVVVGFIDGHQDQPVIVGALWSDIDPVPPNVDATSSNNTRSIVSRAGSELTFDDTSGATSITLKSAGGMKLVLDDKAQTLTIQFNDSTKIELSTAGVTVKGSTINLN